MGRGYVVQGSRKEGECVPAATLEQLFLDCVECILDSSALPYYGQCHLAKLQLPASRGLEQATGQSIAYRLQQHLGPLSMLHSCRNNRCVQLQLLHQCSHSELIWVLGVCAIGVMLQIWQTTPTAPWLLWCARLAATPNPPNLSQRCGSQDCWCAWIHCCLGEVLAAELFREVIIFLRGRLGGKIPQLPTKTTLRFQYLLPAPTHRAVCCNHPARLVW